MEMETQVNGFREAAIFARAELEDAKQELAWSETNIDFLSRSLTEAEGRRDASLENLEWLKRALDTKTFRSLCCREEREGYKSENILLRDEN